MYVCMLMNAEYYDVYVKYTHTHTHTHTHTMPSHNTSEQVIKLL